MTSRTDIAATERARDTGLAHAVGLWPLTGSFVGILIGAGIFSVPATMAAAVGGYAPVAYAACAVVMGTIMLCFAEATARVPSSGGPYGFAVAAFGPFWGWMVGAANLASAALASGALVAAAVGVIGTMVPGVAGGAGRALAIAGWFGLLTIINIRGVGIAARFVSLTTAIKLLPLLLFLVVGVTAVHPGNFQLPVMVNASDAGRAAIMGIFMFSGLECGLGIAGEVRDPARNIPRAMFMALFAVALLAIAIQMVAMGIMGPALGQSLAPLPDAIARVSAPLRLVLVLGAAASALGYVASDSMVSSRALFAFGRDGMAPAAFGKVHARTHAPFVAITVYAVVTAALAISGTFEKLAILSTLLVVLVYIIGCAAALKLRRDNIELAGPVHKIPGLFAAALFSFAAMTWLGLQSTRDEAIGVALFLIVTSTAYRFRRKPQAAAVA